MIYIFLFLFSFNGNETSYVVVPQPTIETCQTNGRLMIKDANSSWSMRSAPFNHYQCLDLSKPLPEDFTWAIK